MEATDDWRADIAQLQRVIAEGGLTGALHEGLKELKAVVAQPTLIRQIDAVLEDDNWRFSIDTYAFWSAIDDIAATRDMCTKDLHPQHFTRLLNVCRQFNQAEVDPIFDRLQKTFSAADAAVVKFNLLMGDNIECRQFAREFGSFLRQQEPTIDALPHMVIGGRIGAEWDPVPSQIESLLETDTASKLRLELAMSDSHIFAAAAAELLREVLESWIDDTGSSAAELLEEDSLDPLAPYQRASRMADFLDKLNAMFVKSRGVLGTRAPATVPVPEQVFIDQVWAAHINQGSARPAG